MPDKQQAAKVHTVHQTVSKEVGYVVYITVQPLMEAFVRLGRKQSETSNTADTALVQQVSRRKQDE